MLIPEFIRFYGYTLEQTLNEFAVTFFSLVNSMYRLKANEALTDMSVSNATQETVDLYRKQAKGVHGVVTETRIAKRYKK